MTIALRDKEHWARDQNLAPVLVTASANASKVIWGYNRGAQVVLAQIVPIDFATSDTIACTQSGMRSTFSSISQKGGSLEGQVMQTLPLAVYMDTRRTYGRWFSEQRKHIWLLFFAVSHWCHLYVATDTHKVFLLNQNCCCTSSAFPYWSNPCTESKNSPSFLSRIDLASRAEVVCAHNWPSPAVIGEWVDHQHLKIQRPGETFSTEVNSRRAY